jgi:hypothetical protein
MEDTRNQQQQPSTPDTVVGSGSPPGSAGPPGPEAPPQAGPAAPPGRPENGWHEGGRWRARGDWARDAYHPFDPRRKSPFLASFLSCMPGLGQIYVGYYQVGFIHALVVGAIIVTLAQGALDQMAPFLGFFLAFFWLYNVIDAGRRAAHYNQALEGESGLELPKDVVTLGRSGSLVGGLFLIVIGGILLANTVGDIPLDWLEDWWPLAPILFGIYLVGRAIKERVDVADRD